MTHEAFCTAGHGHTRWVLRHPTMAGLAAMIGFHLVTVHKRAPAIIDAMLKTPDVATRLEVMRRALAAQQAPKRRGSRVPRA